LIFISDIARLLRLLQAPRGTVESNIGDWKRCSMQRRQMIGES
jgi:hypothetical protein